MSLSLFSDILSSMISNGIHAMKMRNVKGENQLALNSTALSMAKTKFGMRLNIA